MQWGIVKSKGHQSVYDKALANIFQERTKTLKRAEQEIEKERIQTNIDHKFEERKVREDLFKLTKDRHRFSIEARNKLQPQLQSIVNRDKTIQWCTSREKQRLLRSFSGESDDLFPVITCTDANISRIMRRSISKESRFHNWLSGLPRIRDSLVEGRTFRKMKLVKQKAQNENVYDSDAEAMKGHSKVQNIVCSVPLTLRDTEIKAERRHDASSRRRENKIVTIASQNWNFTKTEGKLSKLDNTKQELSCYSS